MIGPQAQLLFNHGPR